MKETENIDYALKLFENSAVKHAEATESGNFKIANKSFGAIVKAVKILRAGNEMEKLFNLLTHPSIGVRIWSAKYLLPTHEAEAINALREIEQGSGIHSLTAETVINEWRKDPLKLF